MLHGRKQGQPQGLLCQHFQVRTPKPRRVDPRGSMTKWQPHLCYTEPQMSRRAQVLSTILISMAACTIGTSTSSPDTAPADAAKPNTDVSSESPAAADETDNDASPARLPPMEASPTPGSDTPKSDGKTATDDLTTPEPTVAPHCQDGKVERKVGDSWKMDCNTCRCQDDGQVVCTRMRCDA